MKFLHWIPVLLMVIAMTAEAAAANDYPWDRVHRYKLVKSNSTALCQHMARVYREKFKHPWHQESLKWSDGDKYFGKLPGELFKAFDGVVQTPKDSFYLLLSLKPTSTEFDAVPWMEGRLKREPGAWMEMRFPRALLPILVAKIDVDNDGRDEYLVKWSFLTSPPRNGLFEWGAAPIDGIYIYDSTGVQQADFSKFELRRYSKNPALSHIFLTDEKTTLIRPLKYQGRWYFHAYHTQWPKVETTHGLPSQESIEIFQIDRGGEEGAPRRISMCVFQIPGAQGRKAAG